MLERHFEKLAKDWEVERGFATNVQGVFEVPLEEDLSITATEMSEGFSFNCILGPCTPENKGDFYYKLLVSSNLGESTRGAIFSLDERNNLVISQWIRNAPQYRDFFEALEDFIEEVDSWRAVLDVAVKK